MIDTGQIKSISDLQSDAQRRYRREEDPIVKECRKRLTELRREDNPDTNAIIAVKKKLLARLSKF